MLPEVDEVAAPSSIVIAPDEVMVETSTSTVPAPPAVISPVAACLTKSLARMLMLPFEPEVVLTLAFSVMPATVAVAVSPAFSRMLPAAEISPLSSAVMMLPLPV